MIAGAHSSGLSATRSNARALSQVIDSLLLIPYSEEHLGLAKGEICRFIGTILLATW